MSNSFNVRRRIAIVFNSICLQNRYFLKEILPELQKYHDVDVLHTHLHNDGIALADSALDSGKYDLLMAAGGNGTLNQVCHAVLDRNSTGKSTLPVGVIPLGTANDFARAVRVKRDAQQLLNLISKFSLKKIDAGKVGYTHGEDSVGFRYFINVADIGMGPVVVQKVMESSRAYGPAIAYYKSIIETFFTYKLVSVRAKSNGWEWEGKLRSLAVANARYYGNGLCVAPTASFNDGVLNVFICGNVSVAEFIRHSDTMKRGRKVDLPEVYYQDTTSLHLTADSNCFIQADGEFLGRLPATIELADHKLDFLM